MEIVAIICHEQQPSTINCLTQKMKGTVQENEDLSFSSIPSLLKLETIEWSRE